MEPRIDLITLGVDDLVAARRFYVDGLGWAPALDVPGEVVFLQVGHGLLLALFGAADLEADMGTPEERVRPGPAPFSLSHNVGSEEEVDALVEQVRAAGGTVLKEPQRASFGGYHAYFADPSGFRWEIAHNPGWRVDPDGRVHIGALEE